MRTGVENTPRMGVYRMGMSDWWGEGGGRENERLLAALRELGDRQGGGVTEVERLAAVETALRRLESAEVEVVEEIMNAPVRNPAAVDVEWVLYWVVTTGSQIGVDAENRVAASEELNRNAGMALVGRERQEITVHGLDWSDGRGGWRLWLVVMVPNRVWDALAVWARGGVMALAQVDGVEEWEGRRGTRRRCEFPVLNGRWWKKCGGSEGWRNAGIDNHEKTLAAAVMMSCVNQPTVEVLVRAQVSVKCGEREQDRLVDVVGTPPEGSMEERAAVLRQRLLKGGMMGSVLKRRPGWGIDRESCWLRLEGEEGGRFVFSAGKKIVSRVAWFEEPNRTNMWWSANERVMELVTSVGRRGRMDRTVLRVCAGCGDEREVREENAGERGSYRCEECRELERREQEERRARENPENPPDDVMERFGRSEWVVGSPVQVDCDCDGCVDVRERFPGTMRRFEESARRFRDLWGKPVDVDVTAVFRKRFVQAERARWAWGKDAVTESDFVAMLAAALVEELTGGNTGEWVVYRTPGGEATLRESGAPAAEGNTEVLGERRG